MSRREARVEGVDYPPPPPSKCAKAIYIDWLPSVLFGATALVAGCLMMSTPETLNTRLPDTIQEAEEIALQKHKQRKNEEPAADAQATSRF